MDVEERYKLWHSLKGICKVYTNEKNYEHYKHYYARHPITNEEVTATCFKGKLKGALVARNDRFHTYYLQKRDGDITQEIH